MLKPGYKLRRNSENRNLLHRLMKFALLVCLLSSLVFAVPATAAGGGGTTSVTITKYDAHGGVVKSMVITWEQMRDEYMGLTVCGDGVTHYYCEGPNFDEARTFDSLWDPTETGNIDSRNYGAAMGTDIKELSDLVGGASPGYTITAKARDGWSRIFDYENVYTPPDRQGKIVLTWYTSGSEETEDGYVSDNYSTGMRLLFFTDVTDASGRHVFGDYDEYLTWPENRWYCYFDSRYWPTSSGPSGKFIDRIDIRPPTMISCDASGKTKEEFSPGEKVYVKGQGLAKNTAYKLWLQTEPAVWASKPFGDVAGCEAPAPLSTKEDPSGEQEAVTTDDNGDFSPVAIWTVSSTVTATKYDIVADSQTSGIVGTFNEKEDDHADSPGFQGFTVKGAATEGPAPDWDLNKDHICDINDIVIVGLQWNNTGDNGWIKEDVNKDGIVNISDVVTIGLHFGDTWQ
jgi:hypothetical protein